MISFLKKKLAPPTPSGEELSTNEVLAAINSMQKQLDLLKLAVTDGRVISNKAGSNSLEDSLQEVRTSSSSIQKNDNEKVVEGVFDGQNMVGADGQQYDVPANYASKSKLVEGDILKLTINNLGAFVYKQIKPIDRERLVGMLEQDPQNLQYFAVQDDKKWRLLTASVTYFKGEAGDEVIFLIPADGVSRWAAVENIIRE